MEIEKRTEIKSYFPQGFKIDGAPYSADVTDQDIFDLVSIALENEGHHRSRIIEVGGNPNCANWLLWSVLDELGVARHTLGDNEQPAAYAAGILG